MEWAARNTLLTSSESMSAPPSSMASNSASIVVRCSRDSWMNSASSSSSRPTFASVSMKTLLLRSSAHVEARRQAHALQQAKDVGADVGHPDLASLGSQAVGGRNQHAHAAGVEHA